MFHTATLRAVLAANERIKHLEEQLVPHMVRFQLKPHRSVGADEAATLAAARAGSGSGGGGLTGLENSLADLSLSGMSSGSGSGAAAAAAAAGQPRAEWYCGAYLAPEGSFCQRANTLQGFADCNRWVWIWAAWSWGGRVEGWGEVEPSAWVGTLGWHTGVRGPCARSGSHPSPTTPPAAT